MTSVEGGQEGHDPSGPIQGGRYAQLRKEQFFSLAELNERIRALFEAVNHKPMRAYGGQSRRERFDLLDRPR